jgi:hypothetical protein
MSIDISLVEILTQIENQHEAVNDLLNLVKTDTLKYVTRPERDTMLRKILDNQADIDDSLKATIKLVRNIRRARIRDDAAISLLAQFLSSRGVSVDDLIKGTAGAEETIDELPEGPVESDKGDDTSI